MTHSLCVPDSFSETSTKSRFGNAIRGRRAELGISQEELAQRAGMTRTYVGEIETGRRNPALINIEKLARALGVPVAALFTDYGADYLETGLPPTVASNPTKDGS